MKKIQTTMLTLCAVLAFGMQGCGAQTVTTDDSFSNFIYNTSDTVHIYKAPVASGTAMLLDYESMETASLCNKPNCNHVKADCIVYRLGGRNIPVFSDEKAYYFIDDPEKIVENDDGKRVLKLGSTLYCYDMSTNLEEKICHVDGGSVTSAYGWLLHNGSIYFVSNEYSRQYDENGGVTTYATVGGNMRLFSIRLSDGEVTDYGKLHDVNKLMKYYPDAPYSAETYMKGLFDDKIYFTVSVRESFDYETYLVTNKNYVTYYDLNDNTYHGEPEDYANIDSGAVTFLSKDYLAVTKDHQVSVYKSGSEQPTVFEDENFNEDQFMSVLDDTLFCWGKAFDLNTREVRILDEMELKTVIARYDDSYIISRMSKQSDFDKIPVTDLLPE